MDQFYDLMGYSGPSNSLPSPVDKKMLDLTKRISSCKPYLMKRLKIVKEQGENTKLSRGQLNDLTFWLDIANDTNADGKYEKETLETVLEGILEMIKSYPVEGLIVDMVLIMIQYKTVSRDPDEGNEYTVTSYSRTGGRREDDDDFDPWCGQPYTRSDCMLWENWNSVELPETPIDRGGRIDDIPFDDQDWRYEAGNTSDRYYKDRANFMEHDPTCSSHYVNYEEVVEEEEEEEEEIDTATGINSTFDYNDHNNYIHTNNYQGHQQHSSSYSSLFARSLMENFDYIDDDQNYYYPSQQQQQPSSYSSQLSTSQEEKQDRNMEQSTYDRYPPVIRIRRNRYDYVDSTISHHHQPYSSQPPQQASDFSTFIEPRSKKNKKPSCSRAVSQIESESPCQLFVPNPLWKPSSSSYRAHTSSPVMYNDDSTVQHSVSANDRVSTTRSPYYRGRGKN